MSTIRRIEKGTRHSGEIGDSYSAVSIADSAGTPVAPKIEVGRPAAR